MIGCLFADRQVMPSKLSQCEQRVVKPNHNPLLAFSQTTLSFGNKVVCLGLLTQSILIFKFYAVKRLDICIIQHETL